MLSPDLPQLFLKGDKRIVRMFPNYKDIELAYFRKTGIFPIMHVTTIKQEIVDKYPWVPTNLVKAFEEAKHIAYRRIANPRMVPLAWVRTARGGTGGGARARSLGLWARRRPIGRISKQCCATPTSRA